MFARFRSFVVGILLAASLVFVAGRAAVLAGKPSGGGSVPPGRIYFAVHDILESPFGAYELFSGHWSMKADGADKRQEPAMPYRAEPSRQLHGGRWFLSSAEVVGGTSFPNGQPQRELHATRDDGLGPVQLTNDPAVQVDYGYGIRWAFDDSFISFAAVTWTPVASGGNYTDAASQEWLVGAAIFRAALDWTGGVPVAASPVAVLDAGLYFETAGAVESFYVRPDVVNLDWSPSGAQVVYEQITQASPGGQETNDLWVATLGVAGEISLGRGRQPEWAPNGANIAYAARNGDLAPNDCIWTVHPDGTGLFQVTGTSQNYDREPSWSPDSAHLAFTRRKQSNQKASTSWLKNVLRVSAAGGTPTDLTRDLDDTLYSAYAAAWR